MNISVCSSDAETENAVKQLLLPWNINFSELNEADLVIAYKCLKNIEKPIIHIPSDTHDFIEWSKNNRINRVEAQNRAICVPLKNVKEYEYFPKTKHLYANNRSNSNTDKTFLTQLDEKNILLPVDIIEEYKIKIRQIMEPRVSNIYSILKLMNLNYNIIPKFIRNIYFGMHKKNDKDYPCNYMELDVLRYFLVHAIHRISENILQKKSWNGYNSVCLLTHDVDTRTGLRRAEKLKKIEEAYDVPSTWFIPTKKYELETESIARISINGEIGAHGTSHNAELIKLPQTKIIDRLSEARRTLEKISECDVVGFRAPLLQHNKSIISAVEKANYWYDSSIPTWEPMHPSTLRPHGIGTIYPLKFGEIYEIPLSVIQDHQMIQVFKLNTEEIVKKWSDMKDDISHLGGICSILVHPDYEFTTPQGLSDYEELLTILTADSNIKIMLSNEIAKCFK